MDVLTIAGSDQSRTYQKTWESAIDGLAFESGLIISHEVIGDVNIAISSILESKLFHS